MERSCKTGISAFGKAYINPAAAPEAVKTELVKINKQQNDIIRFIWNYEEKKLNPMLRTNYSIAIKFDTVVGSLSEKIDLEITILKDNLVNVLKKLDEYLGKVATAINN